LQTDRASIADPDSVGVQIRGPADSDLTVVVFRGGWADVDYLTPDRRIGAENPDVPSADAAAAVLDDVIGRICPSPQKPPRTPTDVRHRGTRVHLIFTRWFVVGT
jgi:hypothetical protein